MMRVGVCGIACEKCPRMIKGECPNGETGCIPKSNPFCKICNCAYNNNIRLCFECSQFPCEITRSGPISYGYCEYISGREN